MKFAQGLLVLSFMASFGAHADLPPGKVACQAQAAGSASDVSPANAVKLAAADLPDRAARPAPADKGPSAGTGR